MGINNAIIIVCTNYMAAGEKLDSSLAEPRPVGSVQKRTEADVVKLVVENPSLNPLRQILASRVGEDLSGLFLLIQDLRKLVARYW